MAVFARQYVGVDDDGDVVEYDDGDVPWWDTTTAYEVKWAIFFGLLILILAYLVIGRLHVKSRIRKRKAPLAYHRWMLSREERVLYDPSYRPPQNPQAFYTQYRPAQAYGMDDLAPPQYDPNAQRPPNYQPQAGMPTSSGPPAGGSKVDPAQAAYRPVNSDDDAPEYSPPAGPPPSALTADHTGASTTSNNPYRL